MSPGASGGAARVSPVVKEKAVRKVKTATNNRAAVARVDKSKTDFVFTGHLPCGEVVHFMEAKSANPKP
jgi:hypothetical protein